jgi:DNA-binding winged helix-turn-helix (wHTH) protein
MGAARELSEQSVWSDRPAFELDGAGRDEIRFREYRLLPAARILLKGRAPVAIGSRAFDILHVLVRGAGCIVGKQEIVKFVWPTTTVEESNLRFQVAQLRRVLGDDQDLIKTIPGRGYLFALESDRDAGVRPEQGSKAMEVNGANGAQAAPLLQLTGVSDHRMSSTDGNLCAETRMLLQKLLASLGVERGGAVILYVQIRD